MSWSGFAALFIGVHADQGGSLPPPWSPASLSLCSVCWGAVWHRQVHFAGLPVVAGLAENGADQPQERSLVGEQRGDASPTLDFLIEPFQRVGRAQATPMGCWQHKDREPLGDVFFHPGRQVGRVVSVFLHQLRQQAIRFVAVRRMEHVAQVLGDFPTESHPASARIASHSA